MANVKFLQGTAAQYAAITPDANTFYYTSDDNMLYLGTIVLSSEASVATVSDAVAAVKTTADANADLLTTLTAGMDADASILDAIAAVTGSLDDLSTTSKSTLVAAINEVYAAVGTGGTAAVVTVTEDSTSSEYAKVYTVTQGGATVGTINVPKDMVVSSGEVVVNPDGQEEGTYLALTLANSDGTVVYVNVGTLVDLYTAQASATQVQLTVNNTTREISAVIVAGSIGTTELADEAVTTAKIAEGNVTLAKLSTSVQTSLGLADSAVQSVTTGTTNGTISVDGTAVSVYGLGSAAYVDTTAFDAAGSASAAITTAESYTDDAIAALDKADTAVSGQYVSAVSETDGIISVTRASLPDYSTTYDAYGAADSALEEAKSYTDDAILDATIQWESIS